MAAGKKAEEIIILTMKDVCSFTDFFVIMTARNPRQARAVADDIRRQMKKAGCSPLHVEGEARGDWILMDYLNVVVHVFSPAARDFFRLEVLWKDAPRLEAARAR